MNILTLAPPPVTAFDPPPLDILLRCGCQITYRAQAPAPIFLTLKPRQGLAQQIDAERLHIEPRQGVLEYEDAHGNVIHRLTLAAGLNTIRYDSLIWVPSARENAGSFGAPVPVEQLPDNLLRYTLPSRYCDSDKLLDFAFDHFGQVAHGAERVQAICDWVHKNIEYRTCSGSPNTSASDIIAQRFGVCRDFAHTAVTLCRTFNLPARYVSGYVPDIGVTDPGTPMDFHAYFEVYLGGKWYTFDARFNERRVGRVKIAHGLDAVDGAFSTIYGAARWELFEVWSYQIDPAGDNASLDAPVDLSKRLCGTPLVVVPGGLPADCSGGL
jgi:transglutaminase-like putative cysteine protease